MARRLNPIKKAQNRVDRELLSHIRKHPVRSTALLGMAWFNALDRLLAQEKVKFDKTMHAYVIA